MYAHFILNSIKGNTERSCPVYAERTMKFRYSLKNNLIFLAFAFFVAETAADASAQERSVGFSQVGALGMNEPVPADTLSVLGCTIVLRDENGDRLLTEDEEAFVYIAVENLHDSLSVHPKIEVFTLNGEGRPPVYDVLLTGILAPGEIKAVRDDIQWRGPLPTGLIPYIVRVKDFYNISRPVNIEYQLEFLGSGSLPLEIRE